MAYLIKTIEEVKNHVSSNMTADFDKVKTFLTNAERLYVKNLIGALEFEELSTIYEAAEYNLELIIDEDVKEAIIIAQKIICNLGYLFAIPSLSLSIGVTGIQIYSDDKKKQAFQWQVNALKDELQEIGFGGIEEFLIFLEEKPLKFNNYIISDQYQKQKQFLISTAVDFSNYFEIKNSRFLFQNLSSIINRVEALVFEKIFGETFYTSLKSEVLSIPEKTLVNKYIKPALALITATKAIKERIFSFNDGLVSFNFLSSSTDNLKSSKEIAQDKIGPLIESLTADADQFIQDALEFINNTPSNFLLFEATAVKRRFKATNVKTAGIFMT